MINIIIPAYNSELTIAQALGSLVAQHNPRKFITTLVDDGSTDNTLEIASGFKKLIPLRIIEMGENQGVAAARQRGIDSCECDLLAFLDSDDKFFPYTTHMFNREMKTNFPDMLYSDFISEQKGREVLITGKENITWFHGKVYRKEFLDKYNIKMPPVRYNEDSGFSTVVHTLSDNKVYIPEISYYWSENPNSITRAKNDFNLSSMPNFIKSVHWAMTEIDKHIDVHDHKVFYAQIHNFYHYHMYALYYEKPWEQELKQALKKFFDEMWIEERVRPDKLVFAFGLKAPRQEKHLPQYTPVQWINYVTDNQYNYSEVDFKTI